MKYEDRFVCGLAGLFIIFLIGTPIAIIVSTQRSSQALHAEYEKKQAQRYELMGVIGEITYGNSDIRFHFTDGQTITFWQGTDFAGKAWFMPKNTPVVITYNGYNKLVDVQPLLEQKQNASIQLNDTDAPAKPHVSKSQLQRIAALTEVLREDPDELAAYYARGLTYIEIEEYDKAEADFDAYLRADPHATFVKNALKLLKNKRSERPRKKIADGG